MIRVLCDFSLEMTIMNRTFRTLACTALLAVTASAFAAGKLTPQQCNDYPFTPLKGPVTHAQLMNELSELESVGYDPSGGGDADYPAPLEEAEHRLHLKYEADCAGAAPSGISAQAESGQ
ncbi:conserved exported hypothetical protein [Paraburkholderia caribensis]|nr:conserved exported hypothetical protein [Paraburkholderia caribensis]